MTVPDETYAKLVANSIAILDKLRGNEDGKRNLFNEFSLSVSQLTTTSQVKNVIKHLCQKLFESGGQGPIL